MKKVLLTLGLVAAVSAAYAQGTVNFQNGAQFKISLYQDPGGPAAVFTSGYNIDYAVFYGSSSTALTFDPTLIPGQTSNAGILNVGTAYAIPPSSPGDTTWWVQVIGYNASYTNEYALAQSDYASGKAGVIYGASAIVNIGALGPATGPGFVAFQAATGTNPTKIPAFSLHATAVPEPATLAMVGLSAAALTIFRRRK